MPDLENAPVVGHIGPRRDGVDTEYWAGLAAGELRVQRCDGCGQWWWGPVWRCGDCGSWDLTWTPVEPRGLVYSWIRTHQAFLPALAAAVPYVNVLVELPQAGGRRMVGVLVGRQDGLRIGAAVEGVIQPPPSAATSDMAVLRWRLRPS